MTDYDKLDAWIDAQNRFKQDRAPLGGRAAALAANVGAQ